MSILGQECPAGLPPLPIVPFALALAMFVAYRQFRQSKLPIHRERAKKALRTCCHLLSKLRAVWWSAGAMADLGRAALAHADRGPYRGIAAAGSSSGGNSSSRTTRRSVGTSADAGRTRGASFATGAAADAAADGAGATGAAGGAGEASGATVGGSSGDAAASTGADQQPRVLGHPVGSPSRWPHDALHAEDAPSAGMPSSSKRSTPEPTAPEEGGVLPAAAAGSEWLEFDAAFENIDALLGSGGPALSEEMLRPFNLDLFNDGAMLDAMGSGYQQDSPV